MNGRGGRPNNNSSSSETRSPIRSVISSPSEEFSSDGTSLLLTLTNGIIGGENTRTLPQAFMTLTPLLKEAFLTREYSTVSKVHVDEKLNGVYVIPSAISSDLWFGVIFVHGGSSPYQGGIFRFTLRFPIDFPTSTAVPIVTFQPPVFHPCIHPTRGVFDLKRNFKHGWNQRNNSVWHILKIIKTSFYKVESSSCVNKQAYDMLENDPPLFTSRAQREVETSVKRVYDDCPSEYNRDIHWMKFSPYDGNLHDSYRRNLHSKNTNAPAEVVARNGVSSVQKGLSWM